VSSSSILVYVQLLMPMLLFGYIIYNLPVVKARRRIRAAKIQPIAALVPGMRARVTGTIERLDKGLIAPLTGRPCVHYCAEISEKDTREQSFGWVGLRSAKETVDFVVRDTSGAAVIRIAGAEVATSVDYQSSSGFLFSPRPAEVALVRRLGLDTSGLIGIGSSLRYDEEVLEIGQEVSVLGVVTGGQGADPLVIESSPESPLLVTDHAGTVRAERTT